MLGQSLAMSKEGEHIIEYIIRVTEPENLRISIKNKKRYNSYENRKHKIDDNIFYCIKCKHTWSIVPGWVDRAKWRKYPEGNMPTYKKKRKICIPCRSLNE